MRRWAIAAVLLLAAAIGFAQDVLPVPALTARVVDQTGTLNPGQAAALEAKLAAFEADAGPQIAVLIVGATAPEDIASYAQRVADSWKIGRRAVGDGIVVVVAKDERKVRIEVAKALEGAVPDLAARQIIDRAIVPAFRAGDFAGGLDAAVTQLMQRIRGEHLPAPEQRRSNKGADRGPQLEELALFFFIAVPVVGGVLSRMFGRRAGSVLTAGATGAAAGWWTASVLLGVVAGVVALVVVGLFGIGSALRGMTGGSRRGGGGFGPFAGGVLGGFGAGGGFSGGGGGGGSFGGGFSSGGGGDFGGGGASGDW